MATILSPQEFVQKWKQSELKERSSAQEHFIDLCRLLNHPTPAEKDPEGTSFTFEAGADKQADDPRVEAIAEAARALVEKRQAWLNPEGASKSELKKRTLTNLYNDYPTWLELAHGRLDESVLDAYG